MNKFYREICLEEQAFIKDPKTQIKDVLKEFNTKVMQFDRWQVGK